MHKFDSREVSIKLNALIRSGEISLVDAVKLRDLIHPITNDGLAILKFGNETAVVAPTSSVRETAANSNDTESMMEKLSSEFCR